MSQTGISQIPQGFSRSSPESTEAKPPFTADSGEAIRHWGPGATFEVWLFWRAVERLRVATEAWRGITTPAAPTREKPEAPARLF